MASRQQVEDILIPLLAEQCDVQPDEISLEDSLSHDLDLGPAELISLSGEIHRDLEVELTNEQIDECETVGDLISCIAKANSGRR